MSNSNTKIRGRGLYEVFNPNFGDDRKELHNWLIMDTWPYEAAMWLIAGVIPTQIYDGFGFHKFEGGLVGDEKSDRIAEINSLMRLWLSNPLHPDSAPPQFYFDWAERKNIEVYWLAAAKEWGHFENDNPLDYARNETVKASLTTLAGGKSAIKPRGDSEEHVEKPLMPRERETLLNIIGVMLELLQTPKVGRNSDAAIIQEMIANYSDKRGISKRTLEEKFPAAKRSLTAE